jgi:hypothetical protein
MNPMNAAAVGTKRVTKQLTQAAQLAVTSDPDVRMQLFAWGVDNDGAAILYSRVA